MDLNQLTNKSQQALMAARDQAQARNPGMNAWATFVRPFRD